MKELKLIGSSILVGIAITLGGFPWVLGFFWAFAAAPFKAGRKLGEEKLEEWSAE